MVHTQFGGKQGHSAIKKKTSFIHENSSRYIFYTLNTLFSRVVSDPRYNTVHALEPKNF